MPIYEYQCVQCGRLEIFQRITESPLVRCPTCQRRVTKLISQSSFHLKGSGWYATDYARKSDGDTSKAAKGGAGEQAGSATGGSTTDTGDGNTKKDGGASRPAGKTGTMGGARSTAV
jgi:putative FmdB family regulatory protein